MTDRSIDSIFNQPKEATMQEPITPTSALEHNARIPTNVGSLLITAITPVVQQIIAPLVERIKYLENHSAAADNTFTLAQRIELLERSLVVADKAAQGNESDLFSRVTVLEERIAQAIEVNDERIQEIADDAARMVLSDHTSEYDHDEYDRFDDRVEEKVNEAIDDLDMEDKLRDTLRNMTFSITARY